MILRLAGNRPWAAVALASLLIMAETVWGSACNSIV
jgi:hypothetical protein